MSYFSFSFFPFFFCVATKQNKTKQRKYNPFSSSFARRSAFSSCKFQDDLEISFMDTNGDLGIMSHVEHLRRTPEFVAGKWTEKSFLVIATFHAHKCHMWTCDSPKPV